MSIFLSVRHSLHSVVCCRLPGFIATITIILRKNLDKNTHDLTYRMFFTPNWSKTTKLPLTLPNHLNGGDEHAAREHFGETFSTLELSFPRPNFCDVISKTEPPIEPLVYPQQKSYKRRNVQYKPFNLFQNLAVRLLLCNNNKSDNSWSVTRLLFMVDGYSFTSVSSAAQLVL